MLIIDADILFSERDIENILSHDRAMVCGIYPKKQDDSTPCLGTFFDVPLAGKDGLTEVRWAGRGFMRIRREVFEAMKEEAGGPALAYHNHGETEWDFFSSGPVEGDVTFLEKGKREWVSEDILFCLRAKQLGFPCLVDVRIALGHEGAKVYKFGPDQCVRTDWQSVPGWFSEADAECYRRIAREVPNGGRIAEVGCWLGRSMAALVTFGFEQGKTFELHAVDTFKGTPGDEAFSEGLAQGDVRKRFESNLLAFGARPIVHQAPSAEAAQRFSDADSIASHMMLDAVFIDGAHDYNSVYDDIRHWKRKVKKGGIIAGHDIDDPAVSGLIPLGSERIGNCWLARL